MFAPIYWSIFIMPALKALSDNSNICVTSVLLSVECLSLTSWDFPGSLSIKFRLYHGHSEYHIIRFWVSFKSYGERWYFCFVRNPPSWVQAPVSNQPPVGGGFNTSSIFKACAVILRPLLHVVHPVGNSIHSPVLKVCNMLFRVRFRHVKLGVSSAFLKQLYGVLSKLLPLQTPLVLSSFLRLPFQSSGQAPLCCTPLAAVPECKAKQWGDRVGLFFKCRSV